MNPTANKARGRNYENLVADYFNKSGVFENVERRRTSGALDKGDLTNTYPFTVECKATKAIDLASAVDEAEREAVNAGTPYGVAIVKRRGKNVSESYVVLSLATFTRFLHDIYLLPPVTPSRHNQINDEL